MTDGMDVREGADARDPRPGRDDPPEHEVDRRPVVSKGSVLFDLRAARGLEGDEGVAAYPLEKPTGESAVVVAGDALEIGLDDLEAKGG